MNKQAITFRLGADKRKAIDAIAAGMDRDRAYISEENPAAADRMMERL